MSETVIVNIVGFAGAALLLCFVTDRAGSGSTFAHLFSVVWGPCILAAQFLTTTGNTLSWKTIVVLFGAWWALLVGGLLTIRRQPAVAPHEVRINSRRAIAAVLLLFSLQATVVVYELPPISAQQSASINILVLALRNPDSEVNGRTKCPWWLEIFRNAYFVYLPLAVILRKRAVIGRAMFYILVVSACLLVLTHMTRAPLLACVAILWSSWTLLNRLSARRAWGMLAGWLAVFCVVFVSIQAVLYTLQGSNSEGVGLIEAYYGASMQAYDTIIEGSFPREHGYYYTANMFYYTLSKLGIISSESYPSLIGPYVYNTNIYTFLDVFTLDGGVFGAILGAALVGAAAGWVFKKASRCPSPMLLAWNAVFASYVAEAVANNEFIRINFVMTLVLASVVSHFVVQRRVGRPALFLFPAPYQSSGGRPLTAPPSLRSL
jgi:oligosaccharide repeat unit polymerase